MSISNMFEDCNFKTLDLLSVINLHTLCLLFLLRNRTSHLTEQLI